MKLWNRFVKFLMVLGGFRWIVSEEGDVGFRWMGVEIYYYKYADLPLIYVHDDPPKYHEARRWEIQVEAPALVPNDTTLQLVMKRSNNEY
jgi:hypothetical protein